MEGVDQPTKHILLHGTCGVSLSDILDAVGFLTEILSLVIGVEDQVYEMEEVLESLGVDVGASLC